MWEMPLILALSQAYDSTGLTAGRGEGIKRGVWESGSSGSP
jgi:hypothetical protein